MIPLKILFLSAEFAPLIKVGGLGDVSGSLPAAIKALPEFPEVRVVLPLYPHLKDADLQLTPVRRFTIMHNPDPLLSEAFVAEINGVTTYFIDGSPVKSSPAIYSGDNIQDGTKFCFFSLAAMELMRIIGWQPDIIHAHDWHAAPAVYHLRLIKESDSFYKNTKSLLTVHNLPFLGYGTESALQAFGLPRAHMSPLPDWAEGIPLPLGLLSADKINTVSPGYAEEMLTPEFGANLENFLIGRKDDLSGILNGLDMESWNPENDPNLTSNYSGKSLEKRKDNKKKLLEDLGLTPDPKVPLLAMINRMDYQKGVDLVPDALRLLDDLDWQAVILGTGDQQLEVSAQKLDEEYPHVRTILKFDGSLARQIYAGSDLILIPSRYEPCGLTQMIGMRYGCVPLARATGGLKDTIIDYQDAGVRNSTGFLFTHPTSAALAKTLRRALKVYQDQRRWQGIQRRGMKLNFSWERSAKAYLQLYKKTISENLNLD